MKVSFVTTIFNEEETIEKLLNSLLQQTLLPDEIIIVDANSADRTKTIILDFIKSHRNLNVRLIIKKGNRSVGRNEGIRQARGDIIALSDAGCILDKNWLEYIIKPFWDHKVDVVAGYYSAKPNSVFQKCLIPCVLVMPDRVDPNNFLPASRSMALRKSIWEKVNGFSEHLSHNEDFEFAKKLKSRSIKIAFEQSAVVYWIPRKNLKEAFIMFFRFALGDAEARIFRPKVLLLFVRYLFIILLFVLYLFIKSIVALLIIASLLAIYLLWTILKNYRYVSDWKAFYFLPLLQFTSDFAVLSGTTSGVFKKSQGK